MKKLAKLVLFFSLTFAVLFIVSTGLRFLALRVEWVRMLSLQREAVLTEVLNAARWALSLGLYGGVLIGLSYAVRKKVFAPAAALCIMVMTIVFVYSIDQLIKNWGNIAPAMTATQPLGKPGLMLANSIRSSSTVLVLLEGPTEPSGKRVVATPGTPLIYQTEFTGDQSLISVPPAPFSDDTPWFLKSLAIDLRLNAEALQRRLNSGVLPFLAYAVPLIFLLSSFMFIFTLSAWPLANLCLGCLVFRGVLALETFFNTPEMQDILDSFLNKRMPVSFAVPLICLGIGLLVNLYSFLVYLVKRRGEYAA